MRYTQHLYTLFALVLFAALFLASAKSVQKITTTEKTYFETEKPDEDISVSYKLPVIKPTGKTTQSQTKGGVTISIEIVPFTVSRLEKKDKAVAPANPNTPGSDNFEVSTTPYYSIAPSEIQFNVRIRNNEAVPLKLSEIGFAIIIDGTQWSFPTGYLDDWNKGLVLTGFEKNYVIKGPQLEGLYTAQVVYLFLNGVPTSYNEAGSITKKSNFEWYFECKSEEVQKQEKRTYSYETAPIHSERCKKCSGTGTDPQAYKCSSCDGKGVRTNIIDGKPYRCSKCDGTGVVHYKCGNCTGRGIVYFPKSKEAPVKSSITWTGWPVSITTIPPGAKVSVANTKTGEYQSAGMSNLTVDWFSSDQKSYPIVIDYQDKSVKVLPYDNKGKEISKVIVDFTSGTPIIKKGVKEN